MYLYQYQSIITSPVFCGGFQIRITGVQQKETIS